MTPGGDQDVDLGPVTLQRPGRDVGDEGASAELARARCAARIGLVRAQSRAAPRRAGDMKTWSRSAPVSGSSSRWTIELNCLPRRVASRNGRAPDSSPACAGCGGTTGWKCALPSGGREAPVLAQPRPPPIWNWSPCARERVDRRVGRHRARDVGADRGGVVEVQPRVVARASRRARSRGASPTPSAPRRRRVPGCAGEKITRRSVVVSVPPSRCS